MFTLYNKVDDTVDIDGRIYQVDMSFDNILLLLDLINDETISNIQKILEGINILLGVSFLFEFYSFDEQYKIFSSLLKNFVSQEINQPLDLDGNPIPVFSKNENKLYDLKHDTQYIYASFMQAYGIDLIEQQGRLHWHKFQALLSGLPEDTKLRQVIAIRSKRPYKGMSAEERKNLKELQEYYALPGGEQHSESGWND